MREMLNARRNKILWVAACAVVLVTAVIIRTGFHVTKATDASKTAPPAIPAITTTVVEEDVPIYQTGIGNVTPVYSVTVRVRVDGQLMRVLFHEGQVVEEGELLAEIDPRPYQAALTQVEGMMVRDQALLANARIDLERYRTLFAQDSIPKQQLDTPEALVRTYEGTGTLDQGQIDNARLQLIYSRVTAPIPGRLGVRQVDQGNIVHASD